MRGGVGKDGRDFFGRHGGNGVRVRGVCAGDNGVQFFEYAEYARATMACDFSQASQGVVLWRCRDEAEMKSLKDRYDEEHHGGGKDYLS